MASTNRTPNLQLNQWAATDRPKMEDFNADNLKIDQAMPEFGTYTGNGEAERLIALGYQPTFGLIFAVDKNIVQTMGTTGNMTVYSAFFSRWGCSVGGIVESNGVTVMNRTQAVFNYAPQLNVSGVTYAYIMFR